MAANPIATVDQLVAAREARGLTVDDITRELKVSRTQLLRLETGDWGALHGTAYVRAVLRSYGRLLDADVEALATSANVGPDPVAYRSGQLLDRPLQVRSVPVFVSAPSSFRVLWIALVLAILAAIGVAFGTDVDSIAVRAWLPGSGPFAPSRQAPVMPAESGAGREPVALPPASAAAADQPGTSGNAAASATSIPAAGVRPADGMMSAEPVPAPGALPSRAGERR